MPPADLVPDVPNDLDTLCVVTLGRHNDGPRTPAELAQQLAPWPTAAEAPVPVRGRTGASAAARAPAAPAGSGAHALPAAPPSGPGETAAASNGTGASQLPVRAPGSTAAQLPPPLMAPPSRPGQGRPAGGPRGAQPPENDLFTPAVPVADTPAPAGPPGAPARNSAAAAIASSHAARAAGTGAADAHGRGASADRPEDGVRTGRRRGHRGGGLGRACRRPGRTPRKTVPVKKSAKKAAQPGARPVKQAGAKHGSGRAGTTFDTGEQLLPWADRWQDADAATDPLETTGPFPIVIPPEPPTGEQSRFVIVAVSAVIVLVLLIAMFSVRDLFSGDDEGSAVSPDNSSVSTQPPVATGGPSAATTAPAPEVTTLSPSAAAPRVAAIRALDPEGDNDEDTRRSPRAVDGDPSTTWRSQSYNSAEFGGLKTGVGPVAQAGGPRGASAPSSST